MISAALLDMVRCPDCAGRLGRESASVQCVQCGRTFATASGYLDLRPLAAYAEQTKYLEEALHADARHEAIAPPLLGSRVRVQMLRRFLAPAPGDRIIDLGCGNGRAIAWNADSGASIVGIDISPYFAREAIERSDLVLGDLRKLPIEDGVFSKAWSLDVMEHLSPQALADVLAEANRVLAEGGCLFIYTHVRKNGWIAGGVRAVNGFARLCERAGLIDLRQERLRKSDHLNPIADHADLQVILARAGFELERVTYYTPIIGAFVENVLARMTERVMARREARRSPSAGADERAAVRAARTSAQARVARGGFTFKALRALSQVMMLDVALFGHLQSGPFFALLRKTAAPVAAGTPRAAGAAPGA